ncbi:MAG: hypothetical protein K2M06_02435 [Muribaculaceae bacterium]|nr:hypothetical protein [Muribaculaceae bacterium]
MKELIETSKNSSWKGYTLEELYLRRAEIYARKEIEKYRLTLATEGMRRSTPLLGGGGSGLMSKASGWMSYLEYGLVAYRVVRRVLPFFRRRKK